MASIRGIYYTATTLDGYIADEHDSLEWLFEQEGEDGGPAAYEPFIGGVGAIAMGSTTYLWVTDHLKSSGEAWPYEQPCWVFTHRHLEPVADNVRFVSGSVEEHHAAIAESSGGKDIWVCGGGDLAGQFADAGHLHRVVVSIAPVTLGAGRPLFPRRFDLELVELARSGDFATAIYDVVGPRTDQKQD